MTFWKNSPQGLDTVVGARGVYLSGGEQQRIALARAILKDAPIVVLDEATAFADPENEHQIQKAFEALIRNKTVLMIAHRLSTVQDADHIIVLSGGKIAEQGSHESLLAQHGVYAAMWEDYQQSARWKVGRTDPKSGKGGKDRMTKKLQHVFALSEKGAKDLVKSRRLVFCVQLKPDASGGGRPVYGTAPFGCHGNRRQSHGGLLDLHRLCPGDSNSFCLSSTGSSMLPCIWPLIKRAPAGG